MEKRIDRVAQRLGAGESDFGPILWVDTTVWPLEDQDVYRTGTPEEQVALIEAHTGRRPAAIGARGPIRTIIDMPPAPLDSGAAIAEAERILDRSER